MTALAVRELTVTLDRNPVVRGVSCAAAAGGWLSLIGPNGAGKSTLIRAAAGLVPYQGTVLLDEPTSMLDVGHQQQVLELVDGLRGDGGLTVLSTLHDLTAAGQYADELVLLHEGQVAAAGQAAAVLTAALIGTVYAARVSVIAGPDGRPVVAPLRPRPDTGPRG